MRFNLLIIILMLLTGCVSNPSYEATINANKYLIGTWEGTGGLLNLDLKSQCGEIPISVIIKENEIEGSINNQSFYSRDLIPTDFGFTVEVELEQAPLGFCEVDKTFLSILIVLPDSHHTQTTLSDANFHLRSNGVFDFGMLVGGVKLKKRAN